MGPCAPPYQLSGADTNGQLFVCEIIGAGFGPPRHLHYEQDEWFYVTSGMFRIEIGGELFDARPGDSLFAPRNVPHAWAPTGDGQGTMVFALQPAGPFESFIRAGVRCAETIRDSNGISSAASVSAACCIVCQSD